MVKTVQSKIAVVIDRVERLRMLSDKINTFNAYAQSADLKDLTERNLQIAIEACFDIGKIIISQKMLRDPKDNKDIFVILAEAGIIGLQSLEFSLPWRAHGIFWCMGTTKSTTVSSTAFSSDTLTILMFS